MLCELELPWPPSTNHYKSVGRMVTTKSGKIYQQRVNSIETQQFFCDVYNLIRKKRLPCFKNERLDIEIWLHAPDNRKIDLDNRLKVLLDALQQAKLYADDNQIDKLLVVRKEIIKKGRVDIILKSI